MFKLRTVIIEDEEYNREWLKRKLENCPEIDLVGCAGSPDDAFNLIAAQRPDAAFMDIQLAGGDAFQIIARLKANGLTIPYIVFATGYPDYVMTALNEYRQYVVQYLVKPFVQDWDDKLRKCIDSLIAAKMRDMEFATTPTKSQTHFFIQNRGTLLRLEPDTIAYLESAGGGEVILVLDNLTHQIDYTLAKMKDLLPDQQFIRVSRTNIVNINKILKLNREERTIDVQIGQKIKNIGIGDAYYSDLIKALI